MSNAKAQSSNSKVQLLHHLTFKHLPFISHLDFDIWISC
jgi:hypothetical protein